VGAEVSTLLDASFSHRETVRLIRGSRLLDPITRRQWLKVVPHLSSSDRARLEEILRSDEEAREALPPSPTIGGRLKGGGSRRASPLHPTG
jgi:hypothetical protein